MGGVHSEAVMRAAFGVFELESVPLEEHSHEPVNAGARLRSCRLLVCCLPVLLLEQQFTNAKQSGPEQRPHLC